MHELFNVKLSARDASESSVRGVRRMIQKHGTDKPMPSKRGTVGKESEVAKLLSIGSRVWLKPGTKLAAKFPHLVRQIGLTS